MVRVLLVASGCGRLGFEHEPGGGVGPDPDAAVTAGCWEAWHAHAPIVGAPALVNELTSSLDEDNPFFADEHTLYFNRRYEGRREIAVTRRPARGHVFESDEIVELSEPAADEGRLTRSEDGLIAVFASDRSGDRELWLATRTDTSAAFGAPTMMPLEQPNVGPGQGDPELRGGGLRLYYSVELAANDPRLRVASRPDRGAAFSPGTAVPGIDAERVTSDPALSPDELVIVFSTPGTSSGLDLYYATRDSVTEPFGPAEPVPMVSAPGVVDETGATLAPDGCELMFSRDHADLYLVAIEPG